MISSSLAELYNGPVVLYVTPEYFTNPASAHTPPPFVEGIARYDISGTYQWNGSVFPALADRVRTNATLGQLTQKGVTECNKTLAGSFESSYESIVFVQTSVTSENSSLIEVGYYGIHGDRVRYGSSTDGPTGITQPINYYNLTDCWVGATEEVDCHLLLSLDLMLGVVIANTICCCVMMIMALRFTKPSLVTLGDAIASFLDTEDYTTASLRTIINRRKSQTEWLMQRTVVYKHKERRWGSSPSRLRWRFSILMQVISYVIIYFSASNTHIDVYQLLQSLVACLVWVCIMKYLTWKLKLTVGQYGAWASESRIQDLALLIQVSQVARTQLPSFYLQTLRRLRFLLDISLLITF